MTHANEVINRETDYAFDITSSLPATSVTINLICAIVFDDPSEEFLYFGDSTDYRQLRSPPRWCVGCRITAPIVVKLNNIISP